MTVPQTIEVHPGCRAVVELDPELVFECVQQCSWCCHIGVLLYDRDRRELQAREPSCPAIQRSGEWRFIERQPKARETHVGEDGEACFFLRDDGRCALHVEHDWKPTRCSVFPLQVFFEGGELRVAVRQVAREHCAGLGEGQRRIVDQLDELLPVLLWELGNPSTDVDR